MSGKAVQSGVLYPRKDGSTFDMKYYLATHMPLVQKHWGKLGLTSWRVAQLGDQSPYAVSCIMEWESGEAVANAFKSEGVQEIMADINNFSSEQPVMFQGEIVGQSGQ
ncbi:hypothetical protein K491DRAFT_603087 [Lophiostoma macrostomum CBS 122681]|uniref:EthD domain-containing protein n=1 Tax=Lophiostoma macrostomum CBS 122681 TaxID=1314788 RepID=A0A6A6T1W2_9PLEO|nr:hypothetical protein K491DRAFT_603087 [Lophiostoma macrostomum CBS 122681]